MAQHTITAERGYTIDLEWMNAGQPDDGLRIVTHRIAGNRTVTLLTVPGDDSAPVYKRVANGFEHVSGPQIRMTAKQYQAIYAPADMGAQLPI